MNVRRGVDAIVKFKIRVAFYSSRGKGIRYASLLHSVTVNIPPWNVWHRSVSNKIKCILSELKTEQEGALGRFGVITDGSFRNKKIHTYSEFRKWNFYEKTSALGKNLLQNFQQLIQDYLNNSFNKVSAWTKLKMKHDLNSLVRYELFIYTSKESNLEVVFFYLTISTPVVLWNGETQQFVWFALQ